MLATAKVFTTGNSQAVRLPKAFRVDVDEVWISKDETTGEIHLKPKQRKDDLRAFLAKLRSMPRNGEEFIQPRDVEERADPLADWKA